VVVALALLGLVPVAACSAEEGQMLAPGDDFVDFELEAHDGTTVSSADLEGHPYLIYFYPKADTPGCTREACELRDSWPAVQAAGLEVLGVSYDTPETNAAFAEKYHLPFLLLSDTDRSLARAVGAARALLPVPKRISYLVGADGTVLVAYPSVDPASHAGEVLADLKRLGAGGPASG
jgi:peroxiredoxin Q/BCP